MNKELIMEKPCSSNELSVAPGCYVNSAHGELKRVLLCPPDYLALSPINVIAEDWLDKGITIDRQRSFAEHSALQQIYRQNDIAVELLTPTPDLPSQVFARDFGFNLKEGVVLGRFKEPLRRAETQHYADKLAELNIPVIARCEDGIIEGGDFWQLDEKTLVIGTLQRSDARGIANLRQQLAPLGYQIIAVDSKPEYLHLDMIFNIVGYKTAVTYYDGLPAEFKTYLAEQNYDLIKIDEAGVFKHFCNLQSLGNKRVISLCSNHEVNAQLRARGYQVFTLDASEILKTGGGPHCMTFPLQRG